MLVFGRNVAYEFLKKNEKVKKIYLQDNFGDKNIISLIEKSGIPVEVKKLVSTALKVNASPLAIFNLPSGVILNPKSTSSPALLNAVITPFQAVIVSSTVLLLSTANDNVWTFPAASFKDTFNVPFEIVTLFNSESFLPPISAAVEYVSILILNLPLLIATPFMLKVEQKAGYYECKNCGHKYIPDYKSVFMAMHMGRTRYLRCPKCNEKTWSKKVIK